jgi:prophage endopeptidase
MIFLTFLRKFWPELLIATLLVAFGVLAYGHGKHVANAAWEAKVATMQRDQAEALAKAHQERADAEQRARDIEAKRAADMAALDAQHTKEMNDAKADADRTIADLRAGTLRLRERFTCPASTRTVPATAQAGTGTSLGDGAAAHGLQREDAEFLVRESAAATNEALKLKACQAIIMGDRK